jgi:hypothetical protein
MTRCVHYCARSVRTLNLGAVSNRPEPWSSEATARIERCICGAERRVNSDGDRVEFGAWRVSEMQQGAVCRKERILIRPVRRSVSGWLAHQWRRYVKPLYSRRLRSYYLVQRRLTGR